MKRVVFALVFITMTVKLYGQQGAKIGVQGGIPINDFTDDLSLVAGVDLGYMRALSEVIDLGVSTGFLYGFAEKYHTDILANDLSSIQFVNAAASVRIWPSNSFSLGADIGKAFGLNKGYNGGLYYRPILGYLMGPNTEINASYTGIKLDNKEWTTINIGILYTFNL